MSRLAHNRRCIHPHMHLGLPHLGHMEQIMHDFEKEVSMIEDELGDEHISRLAALLLSNSPRDVEQLNRVHKEAQDVVNRVSIRSKSVDPARVNTQQRQNASLRGGNTQPIQGQSIFRAHSKEQNRRKYKNNNQRVVGAAAPRIYNSRKIAA